MTFKELYQSLLEAETNLSDLESGFSTSSNLLGHLQALRTFINNKSFEVFLASKNEYVYWSHCSTATYNKTYESRLKDVLDSDNNSITNEIEFIESELQNLNTWRSNFSHSYYHHDLFSPITKKIKILEYKKRLLSPEKENTLSDFSNSSAIEKVIYLHKLGVLDFLRKKSPFIHSTNKLAEYLSAITGEKSSTLQSNINPIYSTQTDQNRNPLNKEKPLKTVEKSLILMGIS